MSNRTYHLTKAVPFLGRTWSNPTESYATTNERRIESAHGDAKSNGSGDYFFFAINDDGTVNLIDEFTVEVVAQVKK